MKEILESQHEDKEMGCVLQQVESKEIINEEEMVESLGKVEQEVDFKLENTSTRSDIVDDLVEVVEPSSNELEFGVEEDNAQPPRHSTNDERLEEVDQEMDSIIENFLSTIESSPIVLEIEIKEEDAQPPMPLVSNKEEIELEESHQEEEVEVEESCKEVEVIMEEYKGMELTRPLETSLPKSPSNTTFKWVKFLSLIFTFPLEYGLIETDGQLRALCGVKSKREFISRWKCQSRFFMVGNSKSKCNGWYSSQIKGSRKMLWCLLENSDHFSPNWNCDGQLEDGCKNKI